MMLILFKSKLIMIGIPAVVVILKDLMIPLIYFIGIKVNNMEVFSMI